jgi:hypothetical protein
MTALRAIAWCVLLVATTAAAGDDPLAGLTLEDHAGRTRPLDELAGSPVLVVLADRRASEQADAWGERLAPRLPALTAWRAAGRVAWLSIVDGRGVPDYARDAARERIRERRSAIRHGVSARPCCSTGKARSPSGWRRARARARRAALTRASLGAAATRLTTLTTSPRRHGRGGFGVPPAARVRVTS